MATDTGPGTVSVPAGGPVDNLRAAVPLLRRPFTPEAIRFKVQTTWPKGAPHSCLVVAYIDARLVIDRLNLVVPDLWHAEYQPLSDPKLLVCRLTVGGVTRQDVGGSPKGLSKDLFSDALKRAAVQFGVGVSVYALPERKLTMREHPQSLEARGSGDKATLVLTEAGHRALRTGYRSWLETSGRERFGLELDHGDVEGATIDEEVESGDVFEPAPPPAVEDEQGRALIAACEAEYAVIRELGGGKGAREIPPGTFNGWLLGAQHSHEELKKLLEHLRKRHGEIRERLGLS